jgi:hypothetical protein
MKSLLAGLLVAVCGCGGTTGSALVAFSGEASGPSDATGGPLSFTTGAGADVTLTKAELHLGAVYLNQSVPASGAAAQPCISPGIYVAELFGGLDVDLLSPDPVAFPNLGEGTETEARTAEVWLVGGGQSAKADVNASDDSTHILDVEGSATQDGASYPFTAVVTIGANRTPQVTNAAMPGANPICHRRIVTPILVNITPKSGGTLALRIDPRRMFDSVDFSKAVEVPDAPGTFEIPDTSSGAGGALFKGLTASFGVYRFDFREAGR